MKQNPFNSIFHSISDIIVKQEPNVIDISSKTDVTNNTNNSLPWQKKQSPMNLNQHHEDTKISEDESLPDNSDCQNASTIIPVLLAAHNKFPTIQSASPILSCAPFTMGTVSPVASGENSVSYDDESKRVTSPYRPMVDGDTDETQRAHSGINYLKSRTSSLLNKKRYKSHNFSSCNVGEIVYDVLFIAMYLLVHKVLRFL